MNRAIANYLKQLIAERHYADIVAGIVMPVKVTKNNKVLTYAIDCGVIGTSCKDGDLGVIMPDAKKRSIFYFEDTVPPEVVNVEGMYTSMRCTITLVGWLNLAKLGLDPSDGCGGCSWSYRIYTDILNQLPVARVNIGGTCPLTNVDIQFRRQVARTSDVFGRYTFGEEHRQFRVLPYDFFAIELLCSWRVNSKCLGVIPENEPFECWPPQQSS